MVADGNVGYRSIYAAWKSGHAADVLRVLFTEVAKNAVSQWHDCRCIRCWFRTSLYTDTAPQQEQRWFTCSVKEQRKWSVKHATSRHINRHHAADNRKEAQIYSWESQNRIFISDFALQYKLNRGRTLSFQVRCISSEPYELNLSWHSRAFKSAWKILCLVYHHSVSVEMRHWYSTFCFTSQ